MRIAIVKLSALGDIVHAMVVLQFIKRFDSSISIDWIVDERFKELLNLNPHLNEVYTVNLKNAKKKKSILALFHELNKLRKLDSYDLVIDLQGLIKSAIISRLIPSKKTIGFDKFSTRESLAAILYNKSFSYSYDKNVIQRNISLVGFALGFLITSEELQNKVPFLFYSSEENIDLKLSNSKQNILLISGASNQSKLYPAAKLAKLSTLVDANFYVSWGNKEERMIAQNIKSFSKSVTIFDKKSLDGLMCLISKFDLVIGADTGPTHIAWALNIPSITLFGSTPGYRNTLITNFNKIIETDSMVDPLKINHSDYSIKDISPKEIANLSKDILANLKKNNL
jgi:heptosyltransferase I